ncbi:MAG TPA: metalloregulator ArsR/SmtB family transcription factor [Actinomycetota bacterium]|nr:metalloregulator ArsR/SmtB family transcription factor [Actinomycetota bacterium]
MTPDRSAEVFAALSDPTRRRLLDHLSRRGPASATELTDVVPISRQAVAKHLAVLEEAGLVAGERSGRERRFRLTPAPMSEAMSWMAAVGADWDERLDALRRHLRRR